MTDTTGKKVSEQGPAIFSYGFRPFFLSAALFAGVAVPLWILTLAGVGNMEFLYPARDWHVHEMLFGFLPAVITGFLLTAMPNWTDRPPTKGIGLMGLWAVWVAGRLLILIPWITPLVAAFIDAAFLVLVSGLVWREIAAAKSWFHIPVGMLISLYAVSHILFHILALSDVATDLPERMAISLMMVLLALIGGRVTPNFTGELLSQLGNPRQPPPFSRFDGLSLALIAIAAVVWTIQPQTMTTGWIMLAAGVINLRRLLRWYGWLTWREPLVLVLHLGYGWLVLALLLLGCSIIGFGLETAEAVHALTTGAVGVMTLAVMTRASLGHTGRPRHAGPVTVVIYILVTVGALLRVLGLSTGFPANAVFGMATLCWSGAYLLFAAVYGPFLFRPSLDE
ncbi:NnrS family protein [Petrachloros mirabilis]